MDNGLAIEVKGLTKYFGQLLAVDHVSFEVKKGEFFGFLGPNGAGKTTTARMLTGVIKKNDGEAKVMGYPAGSFTAKQLSGVMPEISNAYLDLTGWGNLMLMAELYRIPREQAKEQASSLLEQLGLLERRDSLAKTYSMGMRKRLVLCMALLSDARILFLDEATSGLDVQSTRFIRALLRNLKQEGKTIFFTTHNMDEAAEMCDRVAIINHGKIVAMDTPDNLSITAGRVYLLDVSFDKPVRPEVLAKLPGVSRLETAQAIEAADRLRAQTAMAGVGRPGGMGGGKSQMQAQMAGGTSSPTGMGTPGVGKGSLPGMGAGKLSGVGTGEGEKTDSSRFRLYTENTTLLVTTLVDFSRTNSLTMNILNVRPPSLEDAFMRLTEEKSREK
ncbi:MAG: ABC transporter ATP-binding protein [Dehalococcoidales bacterium]|nr:ABC transporter ATP-binding protein [Dehalococcoidales bacterium]